MIYQEKNVKNEEVVLPSNLKTITERIIDNFKEDDVAGSYLNLNTKKPEEIINSFNDEFRKIKFDKKLELIYKILEKENSMFRPRTRMQKSIIIFLSVQLAFLAMLISARFVAKRFGVYNDEIFIKILNFLMFYITAIIAEFITMVFFIVKYLFNNKLIDVIKKWVDKL